LRYIAHVRSDFDIKPKVIKQHNQYIELDASNPTMKKQNIPYLYEPLTHFIFLISQTLTHFSAYLNKKLLKKINQNIP